jgi:hypothetical protein
MIVSAGTLPPITGSTSLYVGSMGAPVLDSSVGRSLMVRLSRQAGDTVLRFSYRVIASQLQMYFSAAVRAGSEGRSPGQIVFTSATVSPTEALTVAAGTLYASAVATLEATLPDDATDEVLVSVAPSSLLCSPIAIAAAGMLIDDLRLE